MEVQSRTAGSTTFDIVPRQTYEEQGGYATAMKIIGHKSDKMWKRYNAIEERDLHEAALKVHNYLQENTPGTLEELAEELPNRNSVK